MAKTYDVFKSEIEILTMIQKAIQSANLNFLIGSGCSYPAIALLGNIENEVQTKMNDDENEKAEKLIFDFLKPFLEVSDKMKNNPDDTIKKTLENHKSFLANISKIIFERKSNILPKQATVFSTNYDLFIEKAFEEIKNPVKLNDGFNRIPLLSGSFRFSSSEFFNSIYNNGNIYNYRVQIPSINLIKLHGSLSWLTKNNEITFSVSELSKLLTEHKTLSEKTPIDSIKISTFNNKFSIILPKKDKFKDTLLNQTYYDLLRIYANELDKENTLLISEGFSFADEHILEITKRALKNPTLKIIIFCYAKAEKDSYNQKFASFNNVDIVYSESNNIYFTDFNSIMNKVFPSEYKADTTQQQDGKYE